VASVDALYDVAEGSVLLWRRVAPAEETPRQHWEAALSAQVRVAFKRWHRAHGFTDFPLWLSSNDRVRAELAARGAAAAAAVTTAADDDAERAARHASPAAPAEEA
jgi:hypothetical protein